MADHRVTDLSYGHLGQATYDPDDQTWLFSRSERSFGASIQTLKPLENCLPASIDPPPGNTKRVAQTWNAQSRWLVKSVPDVGPASGVLSLLNRDARKQIPESNSSTLMAIGLASDIDRSSNTRHIQILVIPGGEAGNLLRLLKPRVEGLGWEGHNGIKLRVLNPASSEECYWLGEGGPIKQISFGIDTEGLTSWLAVRRPESTAILRPLFRRVPVPSTLPKDFHEKRRPSRLSPNHILTLKSDNTGGRAHADVSFNPWYVRQFAVVDQQGYWSIWDIEGQRRKRATFGAIPGKSGHIHDDRIVEQGLKLAQNADGWGRVLWAGSVSTLVVCERRSFVVFSLKAQPKRLFSPDLVDMRSADWILDVKRNSTKLDQIFVLTTTQIFWIQINAAGEDSDDGNKGAGARILLSYRHFRHGEDDTLKLELLQEDDACIVFLYSGLNGLIKTYMFRFSAEGSTVARCSSNSFTALRAGDDRFGAPGAMQTLTVMPITFLQNSLIPNSGPAKEYLDGDVRLYQLLALDKYLALSHTLCANISAPGALAGITLIDHNILLPTTKTGRGLNALSSALVAEDQFIVPDGLDDSDPLCQVFKAVTSSSQKGRNKLANDLASTINARPLFDLAFGDIVDVTLSSQQAGIDTVIAFINNVSQEIELRRKNGPEGLTPLLGLAEYASFSDDVDDVSSMLAELKDGLGQMGEDESQLKVTLQMIKTFFFREGEKSANVDEEQLEMSTIYDRLVDLWVSSLPPQTPGPTKLAKERLIRNIAAELYLSSMAVSIRDRAVSIPEPRRHPEPLSLVLPVRGKDGLVMNQERRLEIPVDSSSFSSSAPALGMPTPDPTPSVVSREASTLSGEPREDEAISRLRGYALSVRLQRPLGGTRSSILAHWPAAPGADPYKYSWESNNKSAGEDEEFDSDEDEDFNRRREEARRQRREERFLKRQRVNTLETTSQPVSIASGSQPGLVQQAVSSQVVEDVPTTQPDRGLFGSRLGKKGSKKRRTRGF